MKKRTEKYLLLEQLPSLRQLILDVFEEMGEKIDVKFEPFSINAEELTNLDLKNLLSENTFKLVILNWDFPFAANIDFKTTKELLMHMDRACPIPKKIIIIHHTTLFKIMQLNGIVSLQGILEAMDCDVETLRTAVQEVTEDLSFWSQTVTILIMKYLHRGAILDKYDYAILNELSMGTRLNKIPKKLFISRTSIQRRRKKMKEFFKVEGQSDNELVKRARQERYI